MSVSPKSRKKYNRFQYKCICLIECHSFRLRSPRSVSPQRPTETSRPHSRTVSPSFADSTFSAVHAALNKRQVQVN